MVFSDKYELIEKLGQGAMGEVYKVRHRGLDTVYALKILQPHFAAQPDLVQRFHNEARIMARLRHPHIVRVFDIDRDGAQHYFVMEYIEGRSLRESITEHAPLSPNECLTIVRQIAQALAHAHGQTVIHRDIKPSNILIERDSGRVVVTDFGIAKVLDTQDTRLTSTGMIVGTLRYASPEQLRGADDIDARTDIFSLGMVFYEMLVGRAYFEGLTGQAIIGRQLYEAGDNRAELPPEVAPALRRIVARCIHKDRTLRYADAAELLAVLDPAGAAPQPRTRREKSSGAKRTVLVATTAALITLLPWQGWSPWPPEPEPAPHPIPATEPGPQPAPPPKPEPDPAPRSAPDLRSDLRSEPEPELVPLPEPKPQSLPDPQLTPAPKPAPEPLLVVDPAATALTLAACRWQSFQVTGADAAGYRWLLDGMARPERGDRLQLRFPRAGSHILRVVPASGQPSTGHSWQIQITPNPPDGQEVTVWLEQYLGALQNRDYARLRTLGFSAQAVERLRRELEPRQRHHVYLEDPRGTFQGDTLQISFNRVDRWYDPRTYSMVVDYTTEQLQLHRDDCERITVQSDPISPP